MDNFTIALPIILFCFQILQENSCYNECLQGPCKHVNVSRPLTLLMTLLVIHLSGFESLSHYQRCYSECVRQFADYFSLYGATKLRCILALVPGTMLTWKLFLLQRRLVAPYEDALLTSRRYLSFFDKKALKVLDIDGMALVSYSKHRQGANFGHSKKFRGRPLLQSSASFIGRIFVDFKLFSGETNTETFFKKAVKRAKSLGYHFLVVRADALYGKAKNLLFLEQLSLSYAIGISTGLTAIKAATKQFYHLARDHSSKIIHISKGVDILYLGYVNVAPATCKEEVLRPVVLCRRIHRRKKKNGQWKHKTYYYAIVSNLEGTPLQIFKFYHQRQCIENGFKELRYHYFVNHLVKNNKNSFKVNEFWIASKIFAMTMAKIFGCRMLPKTLRYMRRSTLLQEICGTTFKTIEKNVVVLRRRPKYLWHIRRIFAKLSQNDFLSRPFKIEACRERV